MGTEIERKFLVHGDSWREQVESERRIVQGYIAHTDTTTVRVRVVGEQAMLTIKGVSHGISRSEYEYPVPVADALSMLEELATDPVIDKVRYLIPFGEHLWELDVFAGDNAGLVMAEIELADADEGFELPGWAGPEVSDDDRFYNVNLARRPFREWADEAPA
ncbi:MAG: CYTH domain-containing protein [Actinobacteria bacterium]|nr:CYTH domain-containing protein [Actinomycetota bacterium]MCB9411893.1 CYTH domain-containing protein [Actinomycetota bacterium]